MSHQLRGDRSVWLLKNISPAGVSGGAGDFMSGPAGISQWWHLIPTPVQQRLREPEPNLGVSGEIPVLLVVMGTANGTEVSAERALRTFLGTMGDGPDGCCSVGVCGVAGVCCGFRRLSRLLQVFLLCQEIYRLFHGVCALMIYCMWGKCCIPASLCHVLVGAGWGGRAPHLWGSSTT